MKATYIHAPVNLFCECPYCEQITEDLDYQKGTQTAKCSECGKEFTAVWNIQQLIFPTRLEPTKDEIP